MADILGKMQKRNESFNEFLNEIQTMIRRQGSFTTSQELEQIYTNIHPGYRNYIKRRDFSSLQELTELAEEYNITITIDEQERKTRFQYFISDILIRLNSEQWKAKIDFDKLKVSFDQ
ncbi:hypothetical protein HHI36_018325 [Cryptolaemus montrouzieri]|uniref:Uncharacterized protein n=1 Tax=Cryptolaemus montrouzieri TaxID=559131 RepID=A0ABD2P0I6_9CUCU